MDDLIAVRRPNGETGTIPRSEWAKALELGYSLVTPEQSTMAPVDSSRAQVVDVQTGETGTVPRNKLEQAILSGYRVESPAETEVRTYVEKNKKTGAAKVFLKQGFDELLMGVPDLAGDLLEDPITIAKRKALYEAHPIANALGGVAGFGATLGMGSLVGKGAIKIAEKLIKQRLVSTAAKVGADATATKLIPAIAGAVGRGALEGGAYSAPQALTHLAFGSPTEAGEKLTAGVIGGGLLSGVLRGGTAVAAKGTAVTRQNAINNVLDLTTDGNRAIPTMMKDNILFKDDDTGIEIYNTLVDALRNKKTLNSKEIAQFETYMNKSPELQNAFTEFVNKSPIVKKAEKIVTSRTRLAGNLFTVGNIIAGNPIPAIMSFVAGRALAPVAGKVAGVMANPWNQLRVTEAVLPKIAKTQALLTSPIGFGGARMTAPLTTPTVDEYDKLVTGLNELTPEQITSVFSEFPVDDDTKVAATDRLVKVLEYARANIPVVSPPKAFTTQKSAPSDQQRFKFGRTMGLMMDPGQFRMRLESNTLTQQDIIDMENMYPDTLGQFQNMILQAYTNDPTVMPYSMRIKMDMMMGRSIRKPDTTIFQKRFAPKEDTGSSVDIRPDSVAPASDLIGNK